MKLYYAPGACSLAAHIVLREICAEFDLIKVDLTTKKTELGDNFSQINPHGYVPALQLDNNEILTEGVVIMQYLADQFPKKGLAPPNSTFERTRLQERLNYLTAELHKAFSPLFSNVSDVEKQKSILKIETALDFIDTLLSNKHYLAGDTFSIADAYLFVIVSWTTPTGISLKKWPNISKFFKQISKRESVRKAMQAEGLIT